MRAIIETCLDSYTLSFETEKVDERGAVVSF